MTTTYTSYDTPLMPGDRVARLHPSGEVHTVYEVTGYSPRGKVLLRGPSGSIRSTGWSTSLPPRYIRLPGLDPEEFGFMNGEAA